MDLVRELMGLIWPGPGPCPVPVVWPWPTGDNLRFVDIFFSCLSLSCVADRMRTVVRDGLVVFIFVDVSVTMK